MEWNPLQHPDIIDGYDISPYGDIRYNKSSLTYKAAYHSSNGYDYALFINKDNDKRLFPIDEIVAMVYIPVPHELCGKPVTVKHINGDNRDISLSNLEWIEDIEIWKTCTYPDVKANTYEVSNHGNVRNINRQTILKQRLSIGYLYTNMMSSDVITRNYRTHRLVAWEFIKHKPDLKEVNHIDLNKLNPHFKNLEWINRVDNEKHFYLHHEKKVKKRAEHKRLVDAEIQDIIRDELLDPLNQGSPIVIYEKLRNKYPFISTTIISGIKAKARPYRLSNKYDLNTLIFPKSKHIILNKFSDKSIDMVISELLNPENNGSCTKVYEKLKDVIDGITINIIKDIKRKRKYYINRSKVYDLKNINFPKYKRT